MDDGLTDKPARGGAGGGERSESASEEPDES